MKVKNINFYLKQSVNRKRRQARLGFLSPAAFKRCFYEKQLAA